MYQFQHIAAAFYLAAGVGAITYALVKSSSWGWSSGSFLGWCAAGVVTVGTPLTYTISITNLGPGLVDEVDLLNQIPAGLSIVLMRSTALSLMVLTSAPCSTVRVISSSGLACCHTCL